MSPSRHPSASRAPPHADTLALTFTKPGDVGRVGGQLSGQAWIYIRGACGYAQTYSARIAIRRTSGTGSVTMGPFWLWERDASRPDESTVFGVTPDGWEVSSGEGYDHWIWGSNPAEVNVHLSTPGTPNDVSNEMPLRCVVPYHG